MTSQVQTKKEKAEPVDKRALMIMGAILVATIIVGLLVLSGLAYFLDVVIPTPLETVSRVGVGGSPIAD